VLNKVISLSVTIAVVDVCYSAGVLCAVCLSITFYIAVEFLLCAVASIMGMGEEGDHPF